MKVIEWQAIMNQFEMQSEDSAMRITDILTSISSRMAMDFSRGIGEMSDGIKVSGSIAKEAGFELEEYAALIGNVAVQTRLAGSRLGEICHLK